MLLTLYLAGFAAFAEGSNITYDSFTGTEISQDKYEEFVATNTTDYCTIQIEECNETEWRRTDGSCNNLENPARGVAYTPFRRLLPAIYSGENFEPRKAKSGNELPISRNVRSALLCEGRIADKTFTHMVTHFMVFVVADSFFIQDILNYVLWRPHCCSANREAECVPQAIPADDFVHRFSGQRCLNMTSPISFQSSKCLPNDTIPERVDVATPTIDLSVVYGSLKNNTDSKLRLYEGGLLRFEEEDGIIWPPKITDEAIIPGVCLANQGEETRCHDTPEIVIPNSIFGKNLFAIWFWRNHNRIANELAAINPTWDDDTLFFTAKDINIATLNQIYYYELFPTLFGLENMVDDGLIIADNGFREIYNSSVFPQTSLEYLYAMRWVHTIQEGVLKMYDTDGNYMKQAPVVNLTSRTGWLGLDKNFEYVTQGAFRQACGKFDYCADPDITELGLGSLQEVNDICTNDNAKSRYIGFQPYIKYRELCFGDNITSFDDLEGIVADERLENIKDVYENVEDIELMAGMWVEEAMEGGVVPPTFYCLVKEHLIHTVVSDRHWYERSDRPHAFTEAQLKEVRKATVAKLLCDVGDGVSKIQPSAFLRIGKQNALTSCDEISGIDLTAWKEN